MKESSVVVFYMCKMFLFWKLKKFLKIELTFFFLLFLNQADILPFMMYLENPSMYCSITTDPPLLLF